MPQLKIDKETWEKEFISGEWDYLDTNITERKRHKVIANFIDQLTPSGKILDVGCGLGTTTDFLTDKQKENYLGLDISLEAVKRAKKKSIRVKNIDFNNFESNDKFNTIIFNEVLYYMDEKKALKKAKGLLKKHGVVIVSLYRTKDKSYDEKIWTTAKNIFKIIDEIEISGTIKEQKIIWRVAALKQI